MGPKVGRAVEPWNPTRESRTAIAPDVQSAGRQSPIGTDCEHARRGSIRYRGASVENVLLRYPSFTTACDVEGDRLGR